MDQKNKLAIIGFITVLVLGGLWWYISMNDTTSTESTTSNTTTSEFSEVATSTQVGIVTKGAVVDKAVKTIPKTNPFDSNVSPYDAYKNPFGN